MIGCEDRLRNDLYCVEWGVKPTKSSICVFDLHADGHLSAQLLQNLAQKCLKLILACLLTPCMATCYRRHRVCQAAIV